MATSGTRRAGADTARRILETALELAEEQGWAQVRLREVAARLGLDLAQVLACYRDKDAVANAWFAYGWDAMLTAAPPGFAALPARERIEHVMLAWFDALAPHRAVTVEMLRGKLHPPHPHHWVPMVFDLSRTIHWLREAALLDAGGRRGEMEEVGLTWLFLATLAVWARDDTPGQSRTRRFLRARLGQADRAMAAIWGPAPPPAEREAQG